MFDFVGRLPARKQIASPFWVADKPRSASVTATKAKAARFIMRFSRSSRSRRFDSSLTFIGGTSPVLFEPVYRQAGLGYPRGEIDRQEAFSRRPGATPPPATLLATARKGKPGQSQGRKATGSRFLRDEYLAMKDPKTPELPKGNSFRLAVAVNRRNAMLIHRHLLTLIATAIAMVLPLEAEEVELQGPPLVLTSAWLIDGTGAPPVESAWVRIEGEHIAAVGRGTPPSTPGAQVIDLEGQTILPGLIDMHVNVWDLPQARWMLKLLLAGGVTSAVDSGNYLDHLTAIRRWVEEQEPTPRLYISGVMFAGNAGEMRFFRQGDRLAAVLGENLAFGVDLLNVHNWVSSQALRQIVRFGEVHDLPVMGHVPLSMTSLAAIGAGLRIVVHASTLRVGEVLDDPKLVARYPIDLRYPLRWGYWAHFDLQAAAVVRTLAAWEERIDRFFFMPTLAALEGIARNYDPEVVEEETLQQLVSPVWREAWRRAPLPQWGSGLTEEQIFEAKEAVAGMVAFAGIAHAGGVRVLAGSDTGGAPPWVVPGDSLHRELELLVEAGLSPVEAIRCATGAAAEALGAPDRGTIAPGKLADLVVVRGNVAGNISAIREIEQVMLRGRLYERARLLEEAAEWAAAPQSPPGG